MTVYRASERQSTRQGNQYLLSHFLASLGAYYGLLLHINVKITWQWSKHGIHWPVSFDRIADWGIDPSGRVFFEFIRWQVTCFQMIAGSSLCFKQFISNMLCLCRYGPALLRYWCKTDLGRKNSASYLKIQAGKTDAFLFSHHSHALVTLHVQFLCSDWSKFDRWVHAENLCSILNLVYFDSWSWQSFVSTCDVFNCLFPLDVQNEIQLLSGVFCYSLLVCLLGFWLRNTSLVKVGNPISDGIVFVFHLAWCVRGLQSLKRYWPYLIPFRSCISNGKPE